MTTKTIKEIEDQIRALICEGQQLADKTGEYFHVYAEGLNRYIPATSSEYDEYGWIRNDYGIPEGKGFWFSSSMSC
ncbi:hypothetical protein ABHG04_001715 [Escherichia coli]